MNTAWMAGGVLAATMIMAAIPASGAGGGKFTLESPDIAEGKTIAAAQVFNGFGCNGGNISPALSRAAPTSAQRAMVDPARRPASRIAIISGCMR